MICEVVTCGFDASVCVKTTWLTPGVHKEHHFRICAFDRTRAQRREFLELRRGDIHLATDILFECQEHPNIRKDAPMDLDTERDDEVDAEPAAGEVDEEEADDEDLDVTPRRRASARGKAGKKKAAKKKTTTEPSVKVDPAQALAFVRSRIREEKDPLIKAFFERELAGMAERLKKAEEERRAKMTFTTQDKKPVRIGDHVFILESGGRRYLRGGGETFDAPKLDEYVVKNIKTEPNPHGGPVPRKTATLAHVKTGATKSVSAGSGVYGQDHVYADPRSVIDHELKATNGEVKDAQEQLDTATRERDALLELRSVAVALASGKPAPAAAPSATPSTSERTGKRWTEHDNTYLRQLVEAGESPEAIGEKIGRPRDRVVRQMHKLGIKAASTPFHDYGRRGHRDVDAADEQAPAVHDDQIALLEETHA